MYSLPEKRAHPAKFQLAGSVNGQNKKNATREFVQSYFRKSGVHGFRYMGLTELTWFEKFLWFCIVQTCVFFCITISLQSIDRYNNKSTVISVERDFYSWNTSLPSLTVCPMERLDPKLIEEYCREHNIIGRAKEEFAVFMEQLANSTYTNFHKIPVLSSIDGTLSQLGIEPKHYMALIYNLTVDHSQVDDEKKRVRCSNGVFYINVKHILTEFGLCYMANSYLSEKYTARYLILGQYPEQKKLYEKTSQTIHGNVFNRDVHLTLSGFKTLAIDVYLHSAFDIMKVDHNFGYTEEGVDYDPMSTEITTDEDFEKSVTISQRKCRFNHESNLTHFPLYTRNLCLQECRLNLAYELCKCIPHFYPNRITKSKPVCSYHQLRECFPKYANDLLKLYRPNSDYINCFCLQNCQEAIVGINDYLLMKGTNDLLGGIGVAISMKSWPKMRLKRNVIYSFTDLLVSTGGTAGLFLGFCVLAAVELVYFFTFRLFCHLRGYII